MKAFTTGHPRVCGENGSVAHGATSPASGHPRVCVENALPFALAIGMGGPSPRLRGELSGPIRQVPVLAGHPRVCGEN